MHVAGWFCVEGREEADAESWIHLLWWSVLAVRSERSEGDAAASAAGWADQGAVTTGAPTMN